MNEISNEVMTMNDHKSNGSGLTLRLSPDAPGSRISGRIAPLMTLTVQQGDAVTLMQISEKRDVVWMISEIHRAPSASKRRVHRRAIRRRARAIIRADRRHP